MSDESVSEIMNTVLRGSLGYTPSEHAAPPVGFTGTDAERKDELARILELEGDKREDALRKFYGADPLPAQASGDGGPRGSVDAGDDEFSMNDYLRWERNRRDRVQQEDKR